MSKFKQGELAQINASLQVTKAKDMPEGEFEAILSTEDLDRHGEHVSIKGMVIPKRTIRMYFNHITWGERLPIGTWLKVWKSKDGTLKGRGKIDLVDEFEQKIYTKIKLGTIDSISIGFIPKEYDGNTDTWTKSELSEASVVNEPANPNALVTQKQQGFSEEDFEQSLKVKLKEVKNLENDDADPPEEEQDSKDGADLTEMKAALDDLNSRQGTLEDAFKVANENPAKKNFIKVRVALKQVDQSVEQANRIVKVKLKDSQNE